MFGMACAVHHQRRHVSSFVAPTLLCFLSLHCVFSISRQSSYSVSVSYECFLPYGLRDSFLSVHAILCERPFGTKPLCRVYGWYRYYTHRCEFGWRNLNTMWLHLASDSKVASDHYLVVGRAYMDDWVRGEWARSGEGWRLRGRLYCQDHRAVL